MKIAFLSTRGIPNNYGGFEQFAEYISVGLVKKKHEVVVYSPHFHPYKKNEYQGVYIKHIYSPELWMGNSIGSFFYDFSCMRDALQNEHFDIIYVLGYTSIIPAYLWFNIKKKKKNVIIITNVDGLEYKRTKFNKIVRQFIFWEERMTVKHSHYLVADNLGIKQYYWEKYKKPSKYLAYGANVYNDFDENIIKEYTLKPYNYYLIIARIEPENNIETAIQGYLQSKENTFHPLVIVGKMQTAFAKKLLKKYRFEKSIHFIGGIYDLKKLNSIRKFSIAYIHGHSVGGTNPSLLEAMASGAMIFAHDNQFNRSVLEDNACFFQNANDITILLNDIDNIVEKYKNSFLNANFNKIREKYSWNLLVEQYENYFNYLLQDKRERATND